MSTEQSIRTTNEQIVCDFLRLLSAKDLENWLKLWTEDAVQDMPFSPPEFPARLEGRQAIALVAPWLHNQEIVNETYGGEESVQSLIDTSRKAQAKYEATGELSLVPAASMTDEIVYPLGQIK